MHTQGLLSRCKFGSFMRSEDSKPPIWLAGVFLFGAFPALAFPA